MEPRTKIILIIEAVVGMLILLGGIFVLATEGRAPTVSPSASVAPQFSTYISSVLQVSLKYPYGWQLDTTFNGIPGIERYEGPDGFFQVDADNESTQRKGTIVKKYPKAIMLGETKYRYFVLRADPAHLQSIGASIEF